MALVIKIFRKKASLNPYKHESKRDWSLNDANNSLDNYQLFEDSKVIFESKCQTVSNTEGIVPGAEYLSTLKPGKFYLRLWVEQRRFNCEVHGIIRAQTMKGDTINDASVVPWSGDRWLQHDWQKLKPQPAGQDTRVAWSAGCIILPTKEHARFNALLREKGKKPNDIIPIILTEESEDKEKGDDESWKPFISKTSQNTTQGFGQILIDQLNKAQKP